MTAEVKHTPNQWPDNIVSGDIRYGKASNYDGFYLADASHGIPTFGGVTETETPSIRGQHVRVFNYPGQTEAIAAELVKRWNSHTALLEALKRAVAQLERMGSDGLSSGAIDAIAKAEGRS